MLETNGKIRPMDRESAGTLALRATGWILADEKRAERMLALTGLTPDGLRGAVSQAATQAAILAFLEGHEPDLIAAAEACRTTPGELVAARQALEA